MTPMDPRDAASRPIIVPYTELQDAACDQFTPPGAIQLDGYVASGGVNWLKKTKQWRSYGGVGGDESLLEQPCFAVLSGVVQRLQTTNIVAKHVRQSTDATHTTCVQH